MTHMALEQLDGYRRIGIVPDSRGWEWADPLYVPEDEPNSPDLGLLERYGNPYTVAVLVVAALLALCVAALAIGRREA
jgi:hypothetical protein